MKASLRFRLLISASAVLILFFGLAAGVLVRAFSDGAEQATEERLQVHIYALLAATELDLKGRLYLPQALPEARFSSPGSGLYGYIFNSDDSLIWRTDSSLGIYLGAMPGLVAGESKFVRDEAGKYILYYSVTWENELGMQHRYVFAVAEDADALNRQIRRFRNTLWLWFGGIGALLILAQVGVLSWSLIPLKTITRDLEDIETGTKKRLNREYPRELQTLANNLNALLDSGRAHLERYRNTLGDLAHSLKTPLAILRGFSDDELPLGIRETLHSQVVRMDEIVEYQLHRAAAGGQKQLSTVIAVVPVIEKITSALATVYADKQIRLKINAVGSVSFYCEEGDLFEIAGNLIDNAYKWCNGQVRITVDLLPPEKTKKRGDLRLIVEDDGPGIPDDKLDRITDRGVRLDEQTYGHGIGLAVVAELVRLLRGKLQADVSQLGGIRWDVLLPSPV